jgi:transcriptional regulator with XRE-family HTH domain
MGSRLLFGRIPKAKENDSPEVKASLAIRKVETIRRRNEFANRLSHIVHLRGVKNVDLARALSDRLGRPVSHTSVSRYMNAREFPNEARFFALCRILDVRPEELVPDINTNPKVGASVLEARESENGKAHLRVDQIVDWEIAVKVVALIKGAPA